MTRYIGPQCPALRSGLLPVGSQSGIKGCNSTSKGKKVRTHVGTCGRRENQPERLSSERKDHRGAPLESDRPAVHNSGRNSPSMWPLSSLSADHCKRVGVHLATLVPYTIGLPHSFTGPSPRKLSSEARIIR